MPISRWRSSSCSAVGWGSFIGRSCFPCRRRRAVRVDADEGEAGHPSTDPVTQPLFRRRHARLDKHASVPGVVLAKVTDGLVAGAVVPGLRGLHGRPLPYEHPQDVAPFKHFERRVRREELKGLTLERGLDGGPVLLELGPVRDAMADVDHVDGHGDLLANQGYGTPRGDPGRPGSIPSGM